MQGTGNERKGVGSVWVGIDAKTGAYPGAGRKVGSRWRALGSPGQGARYHVMSRTCGGQVRFDADDKEALRRLLWKMSAFLGVRLLTYCVMPNHFHALVEVPDASTWRKQFDGPEGEERLWSHLETFYSRTYLTVLRADLERLRKNGCEQEAQALLAGFLNRFCDLSVWVKEVKERFSRWFNKRHERKGTLWMDRFKSVLVEEGDALRTMATYIDLNPVRAGLVTHPKDYPWSGYAEAEGGSRRARRGLCAVTGMTVDGWIKQSAGAIYLGWLMAAGREVRDNEGHVTRRGVNATDAPPSPKLSRDALVSKRVRYFSDGLAVGAPAFLEEVFSRYRSRFSPQRRQGARPIREAAVPFAALRGLRVRAVE